METQTKLTVAELAAYLETFLDSQYYEWEVQSVSDLKFIDGFTIATVTYTTSAVQPYSDRLVVHSRRWSYRREDWDNRIIAHFYDYSTHKG